MDEMTWVKASACDSNACVEVGWVRAECDTSACIEVGPSLVFEDLLVIRSSLHPNSVINATREEWVAFMAGVKAGDFDNI